MIIVERSPFCTSFGLGFFAKAGGGDKATQFIIRQRRIPSGEGHHQLEWLLLIFELHLFLQ